MSMRVKGQQKFVDPNRDPALPKLNPWRKPERDSVYDTTSCRNSSYSGKVNRDYAAHWFRWGFVGAVIKPGSQVLDIGCGVDQMMVKILVPRMGQLPKLYVGVDLNKLPKKTGVQWARIHDEFNICARSSELTKAYGQFDTITCFEVIEHMPKAEGLKLLRAARDCLAPTGRFYLSTPVYNEKHMAANHVHEYRKAELQTEIERAGLKVERVHGTFMTAQAIKRVASREEKILLEELHKFYAWDVLANFLAPKYPDAASNCCWVLKR